MRAQCACEESERLLMRVNTWLCSAALRKAGSRFAVRHVISGCVCLLRRLKALEFCEIFLIVCFAAHF